MINCIVLQLLTQVNTVVAAAKPCKAHNTQISLQTNESSGQRLVVLSFWKWVLAIGLSARRERYQHDSADRVRMWKKTSNRKDC